MDALGLGLTLGLAASISPGPMLVLVVTSALRSGWRAGTLTACAPLLSDAVVVAVTLLLLDRLPARALGVLGVVGAVFVVWSGVQTVREARTASLSGGSVPDGHPPGTGPGSSDDEPADEERAARDATESPDAADLRAEIDLRAEPGPAGPDSPAVPGSTEPDPPTGHGLSAEPDPPAEGHASQPSPPRGSLVSILPTGSDNSGSLALRRAVLVNILSPHPWIAWATALGPLTITTSRESAVAGAALVIGFYLTLVGGKIVVALLVARGRRHLGDTGYRRALTCAGVLLVLVGVVMGIQFAGYGT